MDSGSDLPLKNFSPSFRGQENRNKVDVRKVKQTKIRRKGKIKKIKQTQVYVKVVNGLIIPMSYILARQCIHMLFTPTKYAISLEIPYWS